MMRACVLAAALTAPAFAGPSVTIDLTGLRIQNGLNQTRSSAPATIDPALRYRVQTTGLVRGTSGLMATLFPSPTPLAQVLDAFSPGSSAGLNSVVCNPSGALPFAAPPQTQSGVTTLGVLSVTYALTLQATIDAAGVASFSITDVVLQPSFLVGALQFTSGSTVISVTSCVADFTRDCFIDSDDFVAFVGAFQAGDISADTDASGFIDSDDFVTFVASFIAGCD
ncbi:MAG: GC-type dockerin domain-anchored protein [Planctomycetota bacterium]|nr:GC-type dockerin domain-anchored protein [Planctomycetota bacterium]